MTETIQATEETRECPMCPNKTMKKVGSQLYYCSRCGFALFRPTPKQKR